MPKLATAVGNQGGPTKDVPRMLIEFCCSDDSKLSTPREVNENCRCVRVTEKEDGTRLSCRQRLASLVKDFNHDFKDGVLILYASLPCVGGSPWGNVNGLTVEGQERIQEQQSLFNKLFKSFAKLVDEVGDDKTLIAFELSRNCKYWKWPIVRNFLINHSMSMHHFDGCMLGVVGNDGHPIKKGWTIAGNFKELEKLDSFKCDGSHKHGQSRGKPLKLAENYTFRLTDMLHECFRSAAVGQISKKSNALKIACPAKMADSRSAADPAGREAMLQAAQEERNKAWWADIHGKMLYALVIRHQGHTTDADEFVAGLQNDWTPASAIRFFANNDPVAKSMSFAVVPQEDRLKGINPPAAKPCFGPNYPDEATPVVWILVTDSSLALITGRRKTLRKFDLSEHFKERRPEYVKEWIHEMRWGKTLPDLVKRAVEIAKETKQKYPAGVHINVHLCWFGNELVGEEGIAQNPNWPFDGPNGHWPTILKDCTRHLTWFKTQCDLLGVQSAGLTTAPSSADYGIDPIIDTFFEALRVEYAKVTQLPDGEANPRYSWFTAEDYAVDLEFKDQWHFVNSDENRMRLASCWTATMFLIDMAWDLNQMYDELDRLPREGWNSLQAEPELPV